MQLGNFSVSLAVTDLQASKTFYEKIGFNAILGEEDQGWLIMRNDQCVLGLFQGFFEKNVLTFNPGWNIDAEILGNFTDVRELQRRMREQGINIITPTNEEDSGPASFIIEDPDGNPILFDQHV